MLGVCENVLRFLGAPLGPRSEEWSKDWKHQSQNRHPKLMYHMYKFLWSKGEKGKALSGLADFLAELPALPTDPETRSMMVKCLVKKAEWTRSLMDHGSEGSEVKLKEVMEMVRQARDMASDQYAVWHAWAVTNYDQLQLAEAQLSRLRTQNPEASFVDVNKSYSSISRDDLTGVLANRGHRRSKSNSIIRFNPALDAILSVESASNTLIIESIKGFVRSIMLSKDQEVANVLQDTLRLLTLWFSYGTRQNVYYVLSNELDNVPAENWLAVIPQLIARMHIRVPEIADLLRQVLLKVSAAHPQALVCPIYVALNTTDAQRKNLAEDIIASIRRTDSQLVDEAMLVSKELMRVAITAHEVWHEGLERAAHLYIVEKDVPGMLEILMQLHSHEQSVHVTDDSTMKGAKGSPGPDALAPATLRDVSFYNSFGRELTKAQEWLLKFQESSSNLMFLHQAWAIYHEVFKRIATQLKQLKHLELAHVSPALTSATGLVLAVPGTYKPFRDIVRITKFAASVDVISSKQRPRRMAITGSNGSKYRFLLKGHEDLRQDERVMQLFGLVNACLQQKRSTNQLRLKIVRYSVLPLSNNSGLIGWVENCDTLNQLVKSYRESVNIKLNVEHRMLMAKAPQYEKLPVIQKMAAFQEVLDETQGLDIQKMLWLKSRTSDIWIERRTNFTKSLAVTSMTGYILGLGDRHPSNLMLDRVTGRIVHIDFGDCFEVAMHRSKFPETVPFRLTRMLINAMEISGIEGTYRSTCQRVMGLIRDNRDSVMAMLEAFVYDPLISWRLVASSKSAPENHGGGATTQGGAVNTVDEIVVHLSNSIESHHPIEAAADGETAADSSGRALDGKTEVSGSVKDGGKHTMQPRLKKNWEQQDDVEKDIDTLNSK
jgi:FKBP12-rapamycin complex-associated protein